MVSETRMQNSLGRPSKAKASSSFFRARMCGGIAGTGGISSRFFCQTRHAQNASATNAIAANAHQSQAQSLGISTGALISRRALAFVPPLATDLGIMLVAAIRH